QIAKATLDETKQRLDRAFLNATSIQRQAERVTAEEIRLMAAELDKTLGGSYAILSTEFQRPVAVAQLHFGMKAGRIPQLPTKIVTPQIVTGLEGLSRMTDAQKMD